MITGIIEGFALLCIGCRDFSMTNFHFNKPKEARFECLKCGLKQDIIYDSKAAKEPTTKVQRIRYSKQFKN